MFLYLISVTSEVEFGGVNFEKYGGFYKMAETINIYNTESIAKENRKEINGEKKIREGFRDEYGVEYNIKKLYFEESRSMGSAIELYKTMIGFYDIDYSDKNAMFLLTEQGVNDLLSNNS